MCPTHEYASPQNHANFSQKDPTRIALINAKSFGNTKQLELELTNCEFKFVTHVLSYG